MNMKKLISLSGLLFGSKAYSFVVAIPGIVIVAATAVGSAATYFAYNSFHENNYLAEKLPEKWENSDPSATRRELDDGIERGKIKLLPVYANMDTDILATNSADDFLQNTAAGHSAYPNEPDKRKDQSEIACDRTQAGHLTALSLRAVSSYKDYKDPVKELIIKQIDPNTNKNDLLKKWMRDSDGAVVELVAGPVNGHYLARLDRGLSLQEAAILIQRMFDGDLAYWNATQESRQRYGCKYASIDPNLALKPMFYKLSPGDEADNIALQLLANEADTQPGVELQRGTARWLELAETLNVSPPGPVTDELMPAKLIHDKTFVYFIDEGVVGNVSKNGINELTFDSAFVWNPLQVNVFQNEPVFHEIDPAIAPLDLNGVYFGPQHTLATTSVFGAVQGNHLYGTGALPNKVRNSVHLGVFSISPQSQNRNVDPINTRLTMYWLGKALSDMSVLVQQRRHFNLNEALAIVPVVPKPDVINISLGLPRVKWSYSDMTVPEKRGSACGSTYLNDVARHYHRMTPIVTGLGNDPVTINSLSYSCDVISVAGNSIVSGTGLGQWSPFRPSTNSSTFEGIATDANGGPGIRYPVFAPFYSLAFSGPGPESRANIVAGTSFGSAQVTAAIALMDTVKNSTGRPSRNEALDIETAYNMIDEGAIWKMGTPPVAEFPILDAPCSLSTALIFIRGLTIDQTRRVNSACRKEFHESDNTSFDWSFSEEDNL